MSHKKELVEHLNLYGHKSNEAFVDLVQRAIWDDLREEFIRVMTVDSETRDHRRKEFNQAIFDEERGYAAFNGTDLGMVLAKFDQAVRNLKGQK